MVWHGIKVLHHAINYINLGQTPVTEAYQPLSRLAKKNFEIVNFPFLDGDVPPSPSYAVYISPLICFARVCSNVDDFNNRNSFLTAKLLKRGYRYHEIRKAFSKFYHRHSELIVKYNIGL